MSERPSAMVPRIVRVLLVLFFAAQIVLASVRSRPHAHAEELAPPPALPVLRCFAAGDPIPFAQAMTLYLQAFDNQPGISIPFAQLDYDTVQAWLTRILELDPRTQYPLLMASQLYAQVPDEGKQRQMLEFVYRQFLVDPERRWPWLAHAAIMAKHRLHNLPLALRYANALAQHATAPSIPHWVSQMRIFLHEDMGEYQVARVLLGGLLDSKAVQDPHEIRFLMDRLEQLKSAEKSSSPSGN
jgi:hypothetical protein